MESNVQDGKYSTQRRFRYFIIFFDIAGFPLIAGKRALLQRAYNALMSLCTYSVIVASIVDVYMHSDDVKRISTTLRIILDIIMLIWIEIYMRLRKDILRRLFLLTECFTWEEMAMRDIRTGNLTIAGWIPRMNSFIKRATLIIAIMHILQCIAKITTSGGLLFQTWYPFNTSTSPTYEFIQISQVMATVRLAALASAFPHLYAYLVCIACTQLHKIKDALLLVKEKYMKIQYGNADNIPTEGNEEHLVQVEVRHIVKHHQQVLRYMKVMQDYMSGILGGVLLFLMLILCIAAFTAVLNLGDATDMTQSVLLYIFAMTLSFVYCGFGTLLSDMFDSVRHAAWSSDWVGRPVKYQKAIAFIILISSKGFELSAWNIVPVSNSTLMSMVNESMSLFMFLLTMKDKNEDLH